ncbi:homeobox protein knotted-1-like 7 [Vigna umbellata]|uniref:homeobox protein knotted-1-like 7 n=1 Tax=Vigna umbellata TaxID=87088 RepID=UPI001F5FEDF5|nr:homeobox protein knotted-1-like 7 [Vigna umbellata]
MEATHIREKGVVVEGSENIAAGKENEELLKKIIATHPLYEVLIQSHINCLKKKTQAIAKSFHFSITVVTYMVGLSEAEVFDDDELKKLMNSKSKLAPGANTSELDHFMEAYCMALSKLKEAIEEPTKETNAFIRATYHELKQLEEVKNP